MTEAARRPNVDLSLPASACARAAAPEKMAEVVPAPLETLSTIARRKEVMLFCTSSGEKCMRPIAVVKADDQYVSNMSNGNASLTSPHNTLPVSTPVHGAFCILNGAVRLNIIGDHCSTLCAGHQTLRA